jgi:hypothetical protein
MRAFAPFAVLGALVGAALLAVMLAHGGDKQAVIADADLGPPPTTTASHSAAVPTPTWEKYCELGPAPKPWHSWEELFAHAKDVIEKYGPPPTADPASFPTPDIKGPPPPGYSSWDAFEKESLKILDEIQASGAVGRAACTHKPVCVETSRGPVCVPPPGEGMQICLGDGCPTPEIWRP